MKQLYGVLICFIKLSLSLVPAPAIKDGRAPVFSLVDHVQPPSNNTAQRLQTLLQCTNRCELDLQECIGVVWLPQDEIPDVSCYVNDNTYCIGQCLK